MKVTVEELAASSTVAERWMLVSRVTATVALMETSAPTATTVKMPTAALLAPVITTGVEEAAVDQAVAPVPMVAGLLTASALAVLSPAVAAPAGEAAVEEVVALATAAAPPVMEGMGPVGAGAPTATV